MKANGVWTKMKAIYPFVGGSAASHKWNLKDPRDLDAAYRLVFNGGWIHSSTGAKSNGTNGWADTKLIPSSNYPTAYDISFGFYSRTDIIENSSDISSYNTSSQCIGIDTRWSDGKIYGYIYRDAVPYNIVVPNSSSSGLISLSRTSTTMMKIFRDTSILGTSTATMYGSIPTLPIRISGNSGSYSTREKSFIYIGNGLSDVDISNLYTAVQAYQTTLGRQVNVPIVSDSDAQSFLNAANITSFQQASAVNKLVVDLKAAGVWTKMKAIYPFVGGSAASHKWNLKDPRDLDAAYRLVFNGGWTHTSTGALPNGTTGYADTKFNPISISQSLSSTHLSVYTTSTNSSGTSRGYLGSMQTDSTNYTALGWFLGGTIEVGVIGEGSFGYTGNIAAFSGFKLTSTNGSRSNRYFKNGVKTGSNVTQSGNFFNANMYLGAINYIGNPAYYQNVPFTFSSIGDGLTDAEATAFYNAVQAYQTALGRQVNTPVYNNGLVLNLDAGNANSYPVSGTTWFDLAAGNNGTLTNGPTYDTTNGGSILFDGVNDYVITNDTSFRFGNKFTISLWFYFDGLNKTNNSLFSKRMGSAGNYNQYGMGISNGDTQYGGTGKVLFFYARVDGSTGGNDPFDVSITYTLPTAGVYNATIVMDTNIQKLYVNGILVGSTSKNLSGKTYNITGRELLLGAARGENATDVMAYSSTKIHKISAYSYSLSETEVLNNYNSTRGRFGL